MDKLVAWHEWLPWAITETHLVAFGLGVVVAVLVRFLLWRPRAQAAPRSELEFLLELLRQAERSRSLPPSGMLRYSDIPQGTPTQTQHLLRRIRIFIDYPNFLRSWRTRMGPNTFLDWEKLTTRLITSVGQRFGWREEEMRFLEASVYDSFVPYETLARHGISLQEAFVSHGYKARRFLLEKLSAVPGYTIHIWDRKPEWEEGGSAGGPTPMTRESREEGVDTVLMTDLLLGAADDCYDVGLLLTDDADYVSTVKAAQARFHKVIIHVGFSREASKPSRLRAVCWGHVPLDEKLANEIRQGAGLFSKATGIREEVIDVPTKVEQPTPTATKLVKGVVYKVKIIKVDPAGAEVEIGAGAEREVGFIHKHQIASGLQDAQTAVSVGQWVNAQITFLDNKTGRPRLTMRDVDQAAAQATELGQLSQIRNTS